MREIIFRGKRKDNGEWVFGFYALFASNKGLKHGIYTGAENGCVIPYEVAPETVGQFTGLTDKNGKKIFEGDIIAKGFELYEVRWNPEQVRWGIYSDNYEVAGFTKFSEPYFAVIGNIYDDKELLDEVANSQIILSVNATLKKSR